MAAPGASDASVLLALLEEAGVGPATAIARVKVGLDRDELDSAALQRAEDEIAELVELGVRVVGYFDVGFPARLQTIPGPPAVLYVRGDLPEEAQPALAVIGTREPTKFGCTAAETLTAAASAEGLAIISGLALGVDAVAHETALASGVRTAAILGSGLGNVSPRQNRDLAESIVSAGGALISEQQYLSSPNPRSLVARNRLQIGLADSLLVCQTALTGGSLHTVRFAAEQGKPVWVAEPRDGSEACEGNEALIRRGARELPALMPAWRGKGRLAERSGGAVPLGRAVSSSQVEAWAKALRGPMKQKTSSDAATLF